MSDSRLPFSLQSNPLNPVRQPHFRCVPFNGVPLFLQTSIARTSAAKSIYIALILFSK